MLRKFDLTTVFRLTMMVGILLILATVTLSAASADDEDDDDKKRGGRDDVMTEIVYVCVNAKNGRMRAVESEDDCKRNEFAVAWDTSGGVGPVGPQGPQGPIGLTGPQGVQGLQGIQGDQGLTGVQGPQGIQGEVGPAGAPGAVGPAGPAGPTGEDGLDGLNGLDGLDGEQGPVGPVGPAGPAGADGIDGVDGAIGPAGADGIDGVDGAIGPQGPIGPAGADGADGAQGPQGIQGPIGPTGPAGADGIDGATGPQGSIGPVGPAGADGAQGPQGIQGAIGPQGPIGLTGFDGATGSQGPAGADGAQGPQGIQGPIGPTGPAGADGLDGADGATGPQGPQGIQGEIGPQGPIGLTGFDGAIGPQGPAGPAGADGATGPQGPIGPIGPVGPAGADGATGPQGPAGPAGADGAIGPQGPQGDPGVSNLVNFNCSIGEVIIGFDSLGSPICTSFEVLLDNPPVLAAISGQSVIETDLDSVGVSATDLDGDDVTFTLDSTNTFVSIADGGPANNTATINFNPIQGDAGNYVVTVRATSLTKSDVGQFLLEIVADSPPVLTPISNFSAPEEVLISVPLSSSDGNADPIVLSMLSGPAWMSVVDGGTGDGSGTLTGTPPAGSSASSPFSITVRATANGLTDDATLDITVTPPANQDPVVLSISGQSVNEGDSLDLLVTATDNEGDEIVLSLVTPPSFVGITDGGAGDDTATVHITPQVGDSSASPYTITVRATTPLNGATGDGSFTLTIPQDLPPNLQALFDQTITVGDSLSSVVLSATDVDTATVSLSLFDGPSWMGVVETASGTGVVTGSITGIADAPGVQTVKIHATANGQIDEQTFVLTVNASDVGPTIDPISNISVIEGSVANVAFTSSDPESDPIVASLVSGPPWASVVDGGTGDGSGTVVLSPGVGVTGTFTVTVRATANGLTDDEVFDVTVLAAAIFDDFDAAQGLTFPAHTPDISPGTSWVVQSGTWAVVGDQATQTELAAGGDKRMTIDAAASDLNISADITFNEGRAGLVVRYADEFNWTMVWYVSTEELFVGSLAGGVFQLHNVTDYTWDVGTTKRFEVLQTGTSLSLEIDGVEVIAPVTVPFHTTETKYGLFDYAGAGGGSVGNFFDNFTAQ